MGSEEDGGGRLAPRMFCRVLSEQHLSSKSLVWLGIPIKFFDANHEMLDSKQVILENSGGETWEVVLAHHPRPRNAYAGLRRGWDDFACDNGLSVGDVVVFELVKHSHFHVTIFDKKGEEKQPGSNTKAYTSRKRRKSDPNDIVIYLTDDDDEPSEGQAAPVKDGGAANGCSSSKEKDAADPISLNTSPSLTTGLSAAYNFQKQLKNPSCVKIIPRTAATAFQIQFGKHFARLLPDKITTIKLTTHGTLQSWPVRWLVDKYPKMSSGWHAFAKDNRLKTGDVCIFEVLEAKAVKVHIFKEQEQHDKSPRRQTRSIMQALQKNNSSSKAATMTEETAAKKTAFEISMTSLQGKKEAHRILAGKENLEKTNLKICFLKDDETGEIRSELTAWMPLERSKADLLVAITFPNGRALLEHLVKEVST